jgi:hypothetical protein
MIRANYILIVLAIGLMGSSYIPSGFSDAELRSLVPEKPKAYLMLGEELLVGGTGSNNSLVIELFSRAAFYAYQRGDLRTASSACIALAEISEAETQSWLWDLTYLVDPSRDAEWYATSGERRLGEAEELDMLAAQCLYAVRYHVYPESEELFGRQDVRERILKSAADVGIPELELIRVIEQEIRRGKEDPCRGRLYIIDRESGNRVTCPDHLRALGMCANDDDLKLLLRIEMSLHNVEVNRWDAAAAMSLDEPLSIPTIRDLVRRMRVDPRNAYYRDGSWQSTP